MTTAYLALKIFNPEIETEVVPFDQIIPEVLAGKYEAGLIIHEGQLTYGRSGLHKIIDLGVWWRETTKLVLPLGGNAIRRSLGAESHKIISKALRDSIQHGLDHREQALEYAMPKRWLITIIRFSESGLRSPRINSAPARCYTKEPISLPRSKRRS